MLWTLIGPQLHIKWSHFATQLKLDTQAPTVYSKLAASARLYADCTGMLDVIGPVRYQPKSAQGTDLISPILYISVYILWCG